MTIPPIPDGYSTITPYLVVANAVSLFQFLARAFGATEIRRSPMPDGSVLNIEARIGSSMVMIVQGRQAHDIRPFALYMYVPDVDAAYRQALDAGGRSIMEPADQFYGDRGAGIEDPAGNNWWLATRIESLTTEELGRRIARHS
jgi:uncharacterized glyoxalase superfamily protein PhnB